MKKVFEVLAARKAKVEKELVLLITLIENKEDKGLTVTKSEIESRNKLQNELSEINKTYTTLNKGK